MQLEMFERKDEKNALLRRQGYVPAIIYSKGEQNEKIYLQEHALRQILSGMKGRLATTVFTLVKGKEKIKVIVKDIQYHVATYEILHVDFLRLSKAEVEINVPIIFTGVNECAGIKLGGFLRQVIRSVKVKCLPSDIPTEFILDVSNLGVMQAKRLSDIDMPKKVKPLVNNLNEVVVIVAKAQQ